MEQNKAHLLIVEDDSSMQNILDGYLQDDGFSRTIAENGVHGLAALKERLPDLILLDLVMPEMDGWTFIHELKLSSTLTDLTRVPDGLSLSSIIKHRTSKIRQYNDYIIDP